MSKTNKTTTQAQPAPKPLPVSPTARLQGISTIMRAECDRWVDKHQKTVAAFQERVKIDPVGAMTWAGREVMVAAKCLELTTAAVKIVKGELPDDVTPEKALERLRRRVEDEGEELLRDDSYRANSTCPMSNLQNVATFQARQQSRAFKATMVWYLDYCAALVKLISEGVTDAPEMHLPYPLGTMSW